MAKDPYCEVYKAVFGLAEKHGRAISRRRVLSSTNRFSQV
jgi:uncharacterized protein